MEQVSYVNGSIISVKHGFFMRYGGVSEAQFASLNATARVGDLEAHASENRSRICATLAVDEKKLVFLDYLPHGSNAIQVDHSQAGMILNDYDAIITREKELPIAIAVADCNPILLTDEQSFIALIHSGWRGTHANIVQKTVQQIEKEYKINPNKMKAVIGPSIAPKDYPVQKEVAKKFTQKYLTQQNDTSYLLDLWSAVEDQLVAAGIVHIENLKINTYMNPDFYSYREDGGDTGRFMAIAQL